MRVFSRLFWILLVFCWVPTAWAQGPPNAQLLCFNLLPASNRGLSPGLNRGTAEGEWIFCNAVIDGDALNVADAGLGGADDKFYLASFALPTYSKKQDANGISHLAVSALKISPGFLTATDTFGGNVLPIPTGHPLAVTMPELGAFGDVSASAVKLTVRAVTFSQGPTLFSGGPKPVSGVQVDLELEMDSDDDTRIDIFFAIQLSLPNLKRITGSAPGQGFPGTTSGPPSADGAADYASGPGLLFVGFFVGDPTGIATVPIKVVGAPAVFSTVSGFKFCDLSLNGACSGEPLVNGMPIIVTITGTIADPVVVPMLTGTSRQSIAMLTKQGMSVVTTFDAGSAGPGEYFVEISCDIFSGASLTVKIEEDLAGGDPPLDFTDQTVPLDPDFYEFTLACDENVEDRNFGNVKLEPAEGDPHTMGFWGQLVKKAIHTNGGDGAEAMCGDDAPGGDTLPHSGYSTPVDVASEVEDAAADCAYFDDNPVPSINDATNTAEFLCSATAVLPPGKDGGLGGANNFNAQLLALLLNVEAGFLDEGVLVDRDCLVGSGGDISLADLLLQACGGDTSLQPVIAAINELDPDGMGQLPCLSTETCPDVVPAVPVCTP